MTYQNKKVLITGGLGFLGSNLTRKLLNDGAQITIVDNLNPLYGGNLFNIEGLEKDINIIIEDVRDEDKLIPIIKDTDLIFHFAAQVSYIDSLSMPYTDLDLNAKSTLQILELCRHYNPNAKIIFSSSRMVLGKIQTPKYGENHPTNPLSLYAIHKLTSEKYLLMYYHDFGIRTTIFRITNPYGPRQQIKHSKYSLPGWFIRQALEGKEISIFGSGEQVRDYIYIDDIVNAMYYTILNSESDGEIINLGSGYPSKFKDMVTNIVEIVGSGSIRYIPWPENYEKIETGDSIPDISKLTKISGYKSNISLKKGIELTANYYKEFMNHYV